MAGGAVANSSGQDVIGTASAGRGTCFLQQLQHYRCAITGVVGVGEALTASCTLTGAQKEQQI